MISDFRRISSGGSSKHHKQKKVEGELLQIFVKSLSNFEGEFFDKVFNSASVCPVNILR